MRLVERTLFGEETFFVPLFDQKVGIALESVRRDGREGASSSSAWFEKKSGG